jgi:hypothetical protein
MAACQRERAVIFFGLPLAQQKNIIFWDSGRPHGVCSIFDDPLCLYEMDWIHSNGKFLHIHTKSVSFIVNINLLEYIYAEDTNVVFYSSSKMMPITFATHEVALRAVEYIYSLIAKTKAD